MYTKSFTLHRGGKGVNLLELTLVSDWGERAQPTKR
ncbi:addiction module toxin RelE [Citrobacter amalonaticus]|uniref:Addiction module toxin RelE n=1 Tax=Citrobacter amalonaticus TaxID=35703 RepID=A0A2S4RVA5_CITAM|nr:addiction module toxin RelE [Citrobacter amalonaticus]POT73861.1 addiction module toxin RelE [Citrobacter amalonaticus]POU64086.1 addiction module toxin RelE [Citrobacter amalonaticus]POV03718.1 addiction module toxin RelE [Citrobacter amalonaticus]